MLASEGFVATEDGVRLFFQKLGSGPQVVIIPNGIYLFEDFKSFVDGRTLIFYDLRNRGRSDHVTDGPKKSKGIHHDVDDLEAVRRHFGLGEVALIGHSYVGLTVILYAMKYPAGAGRVVQIGPIQANASKQYPAHLTGADATLTEVLSKLAQLQKERQSYDPKEFCEKFWSVLRVIYVVNPADAGKINWGRCDLPNESNFMKYWTENIFPSIQSLNLTADEIAKVKTPILTVHGTRDRSSPYGGGRDWALMLPNARLVTVENAAHAPWIEDPERVFSSIKTFLDGLWPEAAQRVESLDPEDESAKKR
jgi:proline iminopeptidase